MGFLRVLAAYKLRRDLNACALKSATEAGREEVQAWYQAIGGGKQLSRNPEANRAEIVSVLQNFRISTEDFRDMLRECKIMGGTFAARLNVKQGTVSFWKTGRSNIPKSRTWDVIAAAAELAPEKFRL